MVNRIEIVNGDEGWRLASHLLAAVWPPEVVATLPWKDVVWARADRRVLTFNGQNDVIGHAGIFLRNATLDVRRVEQARGGSLRQRGAASAISGTAVVATMRGENDALILRDRVLRSTGGAHGRSTAFSDVPGVLDTGVRHH